MAEHERFTLAAGQVAQPVASDIGVPFAQRTHASIMTYSRHHTDVRSRARFRPGADDPNPGHNIIR